MEKRIKAFVPFGADDVALDTSDLGTINRYYLMDNIGLKLLQINSQNDFEHILAESVLVDESKTKILIKIKQAYFSDGSVITSRDVANMLNRILVKGSAHVPLRDFIEADQIPSSLATLSSSISIIDPRTLEIRLKKPVREFLYYLTLADTSIIHSSQYKDRQLTVEDWKIISGAYFLRGNKLYKNGRSLNQNDTAPDVVELLPLPENGNEKEFGKVDIGYSDFVDNKSIDGKAIPEGYRYFEDSYNTLVFLVINHKSKYFSDASYRRDIQNNIQNSFLSKKDVGPHFKKASQFFLEGSVAYSKSFNFNETLKGETSYPVPLDSITITSFKTIGKYLPPNFQEEIERALGKKVKINNVDDSVEYRRRKETRDFDVYLTATSASYYVATESLNLLYKAKARFADNPNGKILRLIEEYQQFKGSDRGNLDGIVREMTKESEIVPLCYMATPKFYNSKTVDISEMNPNESMTFWKLRVL